MVNRNYISIVLLLIITVIVSWEFFYASFTQQDSVKIKDFPVTIGNWASQELPIDKMDMAILETNNAFLRRYSEGPHKEVYLYIAYSQSNSRSTNPPEIFYRESGVNILDKGRGFIMLTPTHSPIKANWLLLDNDQSQQLAYYWFKVGDIYTQSFWEQRARAAFNSLMGNKTGSAVIRISAVITDGHQYEAKKLINEFAAKIGPQLSSYLP